MHPGIAADNVSRHHSLDRPCQCRDSRERTERFKCPKKFFFGPLPKTSTGKILKCVLRKKARESRA